MNGLAGGILILIVVLIAHLFEEVRTGFRKQFPLGEMPLPGFVGINIGLNIFCLATLLLAAQEHPLAIPFAWLFGGGMFLNGFGHLAIVIYRHQYFPGGITALPLLLAAGYLLFVLSFRS